MEFFLKYIQSYELLSIFNIKFLKAVCETIRPILTTFNKYPTTKIMKMIKEYLNKYIETLAVLISELYVYWWSFPFEIIFYVVTFF